MASRALPPLLLLLLAGHVASSARHQFPYIAGWQYPHGHVRSVAQRLRIGMTSHTFIGVISPARYLRISAHNPSFIKKLHSKSKGGGTRLHKLPTSPHPSLSILFTRSMQALHPKDTLVDGWGTQV